jgi:hypothetical protein
MGCSLLGKLNELHDTIVIGVTDFVGGYTSSVAPHYAILLCGSFTRVQCARRSYV